MNVLILSKNYEKYKSGYYHQDVIDSFTRMANVFIYGPGYSDYDQAHDIYDVISKSDFYANDIDLIVCSTSWDEDSDDNSVDPHPNIQLSNIDHIKKIYFLNKEYKKLSLRFDYITRNNIDLVCTVHPNAKNWERELDVEFLYLPFGISLDRFKDFGLSKDYDFTFSGGLHRTHTDLRYKAKQKIFSNKYLDRKSTYGVDAILGANPINEKYKKYNIHWAEWGAKNVFGKNLLPSGVKYAEMMNKSKVFLNTPSAIGIFNTRFFELMATKSLIFCPESGSYGDILKDGYNCVMFKEDMSDFDMKLTKCIEDDDFRNILVNNAYSDVINHSYDARIKLLLDYVL